MCRCDRRAGSVKDAAGSLCHLALWGAPTVTCLRVAALLLVCTGCLQDEMANQPRYEPLEASEFFADGKAARDPVSGTIARGQLQLDTPFFTGLNEDGEPVAELPRRALDDRTMAELLARGQERFVVFCSHCHGQVGGGVGGSERMREMVGMVVKRGFPAPPTYHQPRLRDAPIGHFFDVITNGFGRMPAHDYLIPPEDRWAIAAYIRALQFSQHTELADLPQDDIQKLETQPAAQ